MTTAFLVAATVSSFLGLRYKDGELRSAPVHGRGERKALRLKHRHIYVLPDLYLGALIQTT